MSENERIPPEILRKVRRIELATRNLVEDLFGGEYHSVFKGTGMEFDEVREYEPGDEIRSIDWNVTARMGRPFIKRFREERELTVLLVVDASASGLFGSGDRLKSEFIAEVASVLAFSAIRNQDKVGCLIFTDRVEKYIPPAAGQRHVLRIIRELLYFKPEGSGTDIGSALETVCHLLRRKAVVFLVSDFMDDGFETPLRLAARRHDLIALRVHDPLEARLPAVGLLHVRDAETGENCWIDSSSENARQGFALEAIHRQQKLERLLAGHGVDEISLDVTQEYVTPLVQFFRRRVKRIARGFRRVAPALLLGLLLAAGNAQAQAPPPPTHNAQPTTQNAQPQGMPVTPREVLNKLDEPTAAELTASARPRLFDESDGALRVESYLARDLQTVGDANELRWTLHLPPGAALLDLQWDLGPAAVLAPWWLPGEIPEEMAARLSTLPPDSLGPADFIHRTQAGDSLVFRLPFSMLMPDTLEIPAPAFLYSMEGSGDTLSFRPGPQQVACMSLLAVTPDSMALRDWKAPGELRGDWLSPALTWGLPLLALLVAAALLLAWWRRRTRPEVMIPPRPAHEEAFEALGELEREGLPALGEFHVFYYRLSLILRRYLGRRYGLPYPDWTREEIAASLDRLALGDPLREALCELLDRADSVKFALREPHATECDASLDFSRNLVEKTREREAQREDAA